MGFEILEAANGLEGHTRLKEMGSGDLALVDINVPEMDDFGFVRAVRAEAAYARLPLAKVTTNNDIESLAKRWNWPPTNTS